MKKILSILILTTFLGTSISMPAFASVKAGSKCTTKGQSKTSQGKKFSCIKSGKKLVWNKGVLSKKSTSKPLVVPAPTNPYEDILFSSIKEIRQFKSVKKDFQVNFSAEDGFNNEVLATATQAQTNVINAFGDYFDPNTVFSVVLTNSSDYVVSTLKNLGGSDNWVNSQMNLIRNAYPENAIFKSRPVWAFAGNLNNDRLKPIIVYMSYPNYEYSLAVQQIGAHELFHVVQMNLDSTIGNLPCWIHEGQASFIGTALSNSNLTNQQLIQQIKAFGSFKSAGVDLTKIESPLGWVNNNHGNCGDVGEYQVGRIANAYLVYKYGFEKNLSYLQKMNGLAGDGLAWKTIFEEEFGISVADFYEQVNPYLKWFFKKYFY